MGEQDVSYLTVVILTLLLSMIPVLFAVRKYNKIRREGWVEVPPAGSGYRDGGYTPTPILPGSTNLDELAEEFRVALAEPTGGYSALCHQVAQLMARVEELEDKVEELEETVGVPEETEDEGPATSPRLPSGRRIRVKKIESGDIYGKVRDSK